MRSRTVGSRADGPTGTMKRMVAAPAPTTSSSTSRGGGDVVRQVVVLGGALVSAFAGYWGSGAGGGTSQQEVGDGALAADATPVAPGEPAFAIWSVIYVGLVAYAVWQALPAQRTGERQRRTGWLVLASMVLNAAWIGVVQADLIAVSLVVILSILAVLVIAVRRLGEHRPTGPLEGVVVDGTLGLYLGWVTVATVANAFSVAVAAGADAESAAADAWAVVALAVAGTAGVAHAVWTRGRLAVGAAMVWGLVWIVVARTSGDLRSAPAAVAAGVAAAAVVLASALARGRRRGSTPAR